MDIYANNNIKAQYISVFNAQLTKTTISKKSIKILRFFGAWVKFLHANYFPYCLYYCDPE